MGDYLRKPDPLRFDHTAATSYKQFIKQFDVFMRAQPNVEDEKVKVATFLNLAGIEAIEKSEAFTYGDDESKDSLDTILAKFKEVCDPSGNVIIERHRFNSRKQLLKKDGFDHDETMLTFISELRILAKTCKFGTLESEMIRDRIVVGIESHKLREQLLRESELTLDKAVQMCQVHEISQSHMKVVKEDTNSKNEVHAFNKQRQSYKSHKQQNRSNSSNKSYIKDCWNCGSSHNKNACPAFGKMCGACNKPNHFQSVCRSSGSGAIPKKFNYNYKKSSQSRGGKQLHSVETAEEDGENSYFTIDTLEQISKKNEIHCAVQIHGVKLPMKIDSGAKCNVISFDNFKNVRRNELINRREATYLIAYGGDKVSTMGTVTLSGQLIAPSQDIQDINIVFQVVNKPVTTILGLKDSLAHKLIQLHPAVYELKEEESEFATSLKQEFSELFDDKLGKLPLKYKMTLDTSITPVVKPPFKIPFSQETAVKQELDRMCKLGVISPQKEPTEWVSNMIAAKKKNGDIRICIDPKDLNKALLRPHHPMRTIEDVAARMPNAKVFSTLDAKSSFWQISLDKESSLKTTFSTPYGRYKFNRLPFGIKPASEVYQSGMEELFAGYPCAIVVDDLLVWGQTVKEHDANLRKVLERCKEVNMKLNISKCRFRLDKVSYVGHEFTSQGLLPDSSKVHAVKEMPSPTDQAGVQRFLGVINYLHKFISNMSEKTAPLRQLLHKDSAFVWEQPQEDAFKALKNDLCSAPMLKFFDPHKPVKLSVDSSKSGLGACLLQEEAPVAYASRSLSSSEQNYAQIEKELLAAVFACTKFHDYIYGRPAVIETDHKPLISIVKKPLHSAPPRLQRMLLQLQKYSLEFVFKCGKELYLADALSRAYLDTQEEHQFEYEVMDIAECYPQVKVSKFKELQDATLSDPVLNKLMQVIQDGWPDKFKQVDKCIQPYFACRDMLVVQDGIILRGEQIVVPVKLRACLIEQAHGGHPGADRTTRRLKDAVYWPSLSQDVSKVVSACSICNSLTSHQQKEPMIVPPVPDLPWSHIGADLFEWRNKHYLVTVDSYSGWFEIDSLHSLGSRAVINKLRRLFAMHGRPDVLTSDNGPQFDCAEFNQFAKDWNFQHVKISPRYSQSNSLAENAVCQAKKLLESCHLDGSDPLKALLNLRNIPRDIHLKSPAQRLMSRRTCTVMPMTKSLLQPSAPPTNIVHSQLKKKRYQQKKYYDKSARPLVPLVPDQTVRMQTPSGYQKLAVVKRAAPGPRSFVVESDGREYIRNRRHLLPVNEPAPQVPEEVPQPTDPPPSTPGVTFTTTSPPTKFYPRDQPIVTKSGRISKPNPKFYGNSNV